MHDIVPSTRAGRVTWDLLLRRWARAGPLSTKGASVKYGLTWEGANGLLVKLSEHPSLPVCYEDGWVCHYSPRDWGAITQPASIVQRAAIVSHRIICNGIFEGHTQIDTCVVAELVGVSMETCERLMMRLGDNGGIPLYQEYDDSWHIDLYQFDAHPNPNKEGAL